MKQAHTVHTLLSRISRAGIAAGAVALAAVLSTNAHACDACNYTFADEVMNERADTLLGRDMLAAMENQKDLPLQGLSNMRFGVNDPERQLAQATPTQLAQATPTQLAQATPTQLAQATQTEAPASQTEAPASQAEPSAASAQFDELFAGEDFIEIIERDYSLPIPPTSYVPQDATPDKTFTIVLDEGMTYLGNGVAYDGFLIDGKIPGPTLIMDQGDIIEFVVKNEGSVPHGASIHAAYTQTSKYVGNIMPGETKRVLFRATHPGVFMYHCAPGGHAIPMHVLFGQYGMMVVKPTETKYKMEELLGHEPDVELYLVQHEWYNSGKDAIEGNPMYTTFNGKLFRYVEEPVVAKPGDYVRLHFLNIGPNQLSTFHIVGILWDYAYWQGHPEAVLPGGQTVTAGPSDSWVVEFRMPPDEGTFLMLSHAVGSTSRGAIGALVGDRNAATPLVVKADGPEYTEEEMTEIAANATRTISPFRPGSPDVDPAVAYAEGTEEVFVRIIGNSYYPKVIDIKPGTKVTWVNEDVFTFMAGEFSGVHNAVATSGPERFVSPLLAHAESYSFTFTQEGEYDYICTPHPYMKAKVIVSAPEEAPAPEIAQAQSRPGGMIALSLLAAAAFILAALGLIKHRRA